MKAARTGKRLMVMMSVLLLMGAGEEKWVQVPAEALKAGAHHTKHAELYGSNASGFNLNVLRAIDIVQATAMDGGEYYIYKKGGPPESPIGYDLKLFGGLMLNPPKKSSYCSGASYTAFVEALNLTFKDGDQRLDATHREALRMQRPDGTTRPDGEKMWGLWNDDGPGSQEAAVQYAKIGEEIKPEDARPGDFLNINWTNGIGHSVVFLGWLIDEKGNKCVRYWSSQKGTNGLGDQTSMLAKVKDVKITRITKPEEIFDFNPTTAVQRRGIKYDKVDW